MRARTRANQGNTADISTTLQACAAWSDARIVAGFQPIRGELSVVPPLLDALARGVSVVLPCVVENALVFRQWQGEPLQSGALGIPEPSDASAIIPFGEIDVALVPGIAFDAFGRRLGQGGGFYDRALSGHRHTYVIGVCWSFQVVGTVPVDPWDERVDAVLTEAGWVESRRGT